MGYGSGLGTTTNNKVEAWVAQMGLQCLSDIKKINLILEGDYTLIVNCLNNVIYPLWEIKETIGRCKWLKELFNEIRIQHIYK